MFVRQDGFDEVLNIFYRRKEGSNQIQIMPKLEMKRDYGIKSPNCFVSGSQVLTDK